jgi:DNA-directed RNA polymerase specialized sigma24 family protein
MARRYDKTTMGGTKSAFQTTLWSDIHSAETQDSDQRRIINNLVKRYWKPVYCYLRRKGYDNECAKDLTQGFFHEIVLGRNLIQQADQNKGRFRTFLLTTLNRYVTDMHRKETTAKRKALEPMVHLEPANLPILPARQSQAEPEKVFHYVWASSLLDSVLAEVKDEYCSGGKSAHWNVFNEKVLLPIFDNTKPPSLGAICSKFGVESQAKVSNMIVTVKRRFRTVLNQHIRRLVESDSQAEQEFFDLLEILSGG